jgi:hypothetical protein
MKKIKYMYSYVDKDLYYFNYVCYMVIFSDFYLYNNMTKVRKIADWWTFFSFKSDDDNNGIICQKDIYI